MRIVSISIAIVLILLGIHISVAHDEEEFAQAEELIKQKVSCVQLTESQLEIIGDYYMEQMHPGELHEIMDERMGGEGSESLKQVHINIARMFYCGERGVMPMNMMNTMMGRSGMMGYPVNYYANSNYNSGINYFLIAFMSLLIVIIILLIVFIVVRLNIKNPRRRNG